MASIYTTVSGKTIGPIMGQNYPALFHFQFVPGVVTKVIHSEDDDGYDGENTINTIEAKPHITNKVSNNKSHQNEAKSRYYPLLRTMHDVPSKGDPVLLCTIGKIKYFLGPLNTRENNVTWNDDPHFIAELVDNIKDTTPQTERELRGESLNFNKENPYKRLIKKRNEELDYGNSFVETTGDTLLEGRHGNSIRIGSRSNNPYLFISNKRNVDSNIEKLSDGSLISITSNGTLAQHFPKYELSVNENNDTDIFGFTLASDFVLPNEPVPNTLMGTLVSNINNNQDVEQLIYNYNKNQILFHSDRIILNSKLDDIYLSSNKDIHIGTKRHLSISTAKNIIIESQGLNIGNPFREGVQMESMVLGEKLKLVLNEIVNMFNKIKIMTQTGPQGIQSDPAYTATTSKDLDNIVNLIDEITSTKHKIEQG